MQFSIKVSIATKNYKLIQIIFINVIIYTFKLLLQWLLICKCDVMSNTNILILLH